MSQDKTLLTVPSEKLAIGGVNPVKDGASYFSLGNEKSVVEMPALPSWMINTPMHSKLPMIDAPKGKYILFTTGLCEKLDCTPSDLDFDASPQTISVQYKSLHDPHLKWHYTRSAIYKRLVKNGFITQDGKVICTLKEFNEYHQYLKQIRLSKIKQDRKRMMEEKQKKIKNAIKNQEIENIRDVRAREARERKRKLEEDKEAKLSDMLSIEKLRCVRLEEQLRLKQKHKKSKKKIAQEKINELKAQQATEERKRKANLLRKRSKDDKKRTEKLEQNRCLKRDEREKKLEQKWNLRERLREMRLLGEIAEQEKRQLKMAKDIAAREAAVEQARARQRAVFIKIQENRSKQIKEREELFSRRLDVKLKKVQEKFRKRSQPQKVRPKAANSSRRSRFSSTWSLEKTLESPDLNSSNDSWIQKLEELKATEKDNEHQRQDIKTKVSPETQTCNSRKSSTNSSVKSEASHSRKTSTHTVINISINSSTHSSVNRTLSENSTGNINSRKPSISTSYTETTTEGEEENSYVGQPKSVDSLARGLVCDILQDVAEEEGYDGYYLSPQFSPGGGSDKDIVNRPFVEANGGSDGEDDWYAAANEIVGKAIDSAIEYLQNNQNIEDSVKSGTIAPDTLVRDNIRRQSIILSSVLNMMDDTGLDLHYVSSSEENETDAEEEGEEDVIGIIDNTASTTSGDGDWQAHSPVPTVNRSRRRSVNEAILAPETLCGFHELESERDTTSDGALRLGGSMRRLLSEERHVRRRHTVPDIVPVFNNIQLNIDQKTVDNNLCAISVKPNSCSKIAHNPIERNSFRDIFKPDMTNCKGTADCLRGVLTQQLSQRRASLRYGDLQHAEDTLVETAEEECHDEDVMSVEDVGGFCYLPKKRRHYSPPKLEDVSENITEEVEEDKDEINDDELDMFADLMVSNVLRKVQEDVPTAKSDDIGEDGVLHTTHHVHAEVINGTENSPEVVISTVSEPSKDVNDVEWYNEWLSSQKEASDTKSTESRTSKSAKSKETIKSKGSSRGNANRRRTSATSRASKRSTSAKSFKEALRTNRGKTRVVASEPIKPTPLTSDGSGSSVSSRTRRRSESFISRFVSSVKDFFTSSKHKTDEDDVTSNESSKVAFTGDSERRIKSLEIIETKNIDTLNEQRTQSMHVEFGKGTITEHVSSIAEIDEILKKSITEIATDKRSEIDVKLSSESRKICDSKVLGSTDKIISTEKRTDRSIKKTTDSKSLNKDGKETFSTTSCASTGGTKNEITTDEIDAIRNAFQPRQTEILDINESSSKTPKTPPVSSTLSKEEGSTEKVDKLPSDNSIQKKRSTPRPPSKKREQTSSSSLRRPVLRSSHRKVKSEVVTTDTTGGSSQLSVKSQYGGSSVIEAGKRRSHSHRSSTLSMRTDPSNGKSKSRSSKSSDISKHTQSINGSRKTSGQACEKVTSVNKIVSEKLVNEKEAEINSTLELITTSSNIADSKSDCSSKMLPEKFSATLSDASVSKMTASRNQSGYSSTKSRSKSNSESKIGKSSSLQKVSPSRSLSLNTVDKTLSGNDASNVKTSSRRPSTIKSNNLSSDCVLRKQNSLGSSKNSKTNAKKTSSHQESGMTSKVQSRTSSESNDNKRSDLKATSSNGLGTIHDRIESITSRQSMKKSSHRAVKGTRSLDAKSTSDIITVNTKPHSISSSQSARNDRESVTNKVKSRASSQITEGRPNLDTDSAVGTNKQNSDTSSRFGGNNEEIVVKSQKSSQRTNSHKTVLDVKTSSKEENLTSYKRSVTSCKSIGSPLESVVDDTTRSQTSTNNTSDKINVDVWTISEDNINSKCDSKTSCRSVRSGQKNVPQSTNKQTSNTDVKSKNEPTSNHGSITSDQSTVGKKETEIINKDQSQTYSKDTGTELLDARTSSNDNINNTEKHVTATNSTDGNKDLGNGAPLSRTMDENEKNTVIVNPTEKSLEDLNTPTVNDPVIGQSVIDESSIDKLVISDPVVIGELPISEVTEQVESVESSLVSKASSGRLLSRPQSDQNRLRSVNEGDIMTTSDTADSFLSTSSNLPEISRPSSAEIVLNTANFDKQSQISLELERPKCPEPPITDQERLDAISPNHHII